jgi:selenocysteine lyase/cysteine desulfurase
MNIDLLAFPGHKGLLGPQGTGGLYIREGLVLETLREGGTGSRSESLAQPAEGPGRYESGTANTAGIAALGEGVSLLLQEGPESVGRREALLVSRLVEGLASLPGITLYGPPPGADRGAVLSLTLKNTDPAQAAMILDNTFDIAARGGLHCAPEAHRTLGTLESGGTLRLSPGYFTTEAGIDCCVRAIREIAGAEG